MAKFGPPEPFDFTHPAERPVWMQRFSRFRVASKLNKETGEVQVNSLLYSMGRDMEPIYGSFVFPAATEAIPHPEFDYDVVVEKFNEHFVPKRNVIHDRACFHKRIQVRPWRRSSGAYTSSRSTASSATVKTNRFGTAL